jgi:hypothetical protein
MIEATLVPPTVQAGSLEDGGRVIRCEWPGLGISVLVVLGPQTAETIGKELLAPSVILPEEGNGRR